MAFKGRNKDKQRKAMFARMKNSSPQTVFQKPYATKKPTTNYKLMKWREMNRDEEYKLGEEIQKDAIRGYTSLMTDGESDESAGNLKEVPYWIDNVEFDANSDQKQLTVNNSMKNLMRQVGDDLDDYKDDMEFAYNSDASSYLFHDESDMEMPKNSIPIKHGGDSSEHEEQVDDWKDEWERRGYKKKGITFESFKKAFDDEAYVKDDLYYVPVNFVYTVHINKKKFLDRVKSRAKAEGVKLDNSDLRTIQRYEA